MARPTWTLNDADDEQRRRWHEAVQAVQRAREATAAQWRALAAARAARIPLRTLLEEVDIPPATAYRHIDTVSPQEPSQH